MPVMESTVKRFPAEPFGKSAADFVRHSALRRKRGQFAVDESSAHWPPSFDEEGNKRIPTEEEIEVAESVYQSALLQWDTEHQSEIAQMLGE